MIKTFLSLLQLTSLLLLVNLVQAQSVFNINENFERSVDFEKIGRGICQVENGVLKTREAYATFGETAWSNYSISFRAMTPVSEDQVQIWAGFRAANRNDRYVFGFRGGLKNDLFLARMGYMGADEFLDRKELDFSPEPGKWYSFRIEVCGNRIRVFIGDETIARIDLVDKNSTLLPAGKVILGGGWLNTEYDDLQVISLPEDYFQNTPRKEFAQKITEAEKEAKRQTERSAYHSVEISALNPGRTEVSLDGNWLFMPGYQLEDEVKAVSPEVSDQDWHTMSVPNFWNPIRIWLHGETFDGHPKGVSDIYYQNETKRCENYTFDFHRTKMAWYRQWINMPGEISKKNSELVFDAVSKVAEVWINGKQAGSHIGMFGEFHIDGSDLFKPGENLVVVKVIRDFVKNIADADKVVDVAVTVPVTNKMLKDLAHGFYGDDPAGIWQPVKLVITEPVKITDVFVKPSLNGVSFDVTVKNHSKKNKKFNLNTDIISCQTKHKLYDGIGLADLQLKPGEERVLTFSLDGLQPELWSPGCPNLYDFGFTLLEKGKEEDRKVICSGFRTFESKDGFLYLNGHRYWLRGGNQTPFALAPNSVELADTFFQLMRKGNLMVTRTHTTPYNELWMDAADRNGIGVSFEGTWPWLMIQSSMPDKELIDLWADEFLDLLKKYRNHPSLLFWTVNNEMKFYDNDPDFDRAKRKMKIISDVVERMRKVDPTRPICFDSNYKHQEKKFGKEFYTHIDDGDIDDIHYYPNWYNSTLFKDFNGQFQQRNKNEGRPLISQEMSTGYPNSETGHATRFYTMVHQNPSSLIGDLGYEYSDPDNFLKVHSFITGEVAEALRRSNDRASGILHFALITWFRNVYDANKIEPYPTYYAMKRALSPVLVSAEIWGRHFYGGEKLPVRVCIVNDRDDYTDLPASILNWELADSDGKSFATGEMIVDPVKYYGREWVEPNIEIPGTLPDEKFTGKLKLSLSANGKEVSSNEYELVFAQKDWSQLKEQGEKEIVLVDFNDMATKFDALNIKYDLKQGVSGALKSEAEVSVFTGLDPYKNCTMDELKQIRLLVARGGKVLLLDSEKALKVIFPEYITGWFVPTEGDISNMEIPESSVFDGIDPLELRYFNNNQREVPTVCHVALHTNRNEHVVPLASHMKIHGYINGNMAERQKYVESIKGFPLLEISDNGRALISTMSLDKSLTDPIAGRLLSNMVNKLLDN